MIANREDAGDSLDGMHRCPSGLGEHPTQKTLEVLRQHGVGRLIVIEGADHRASIPRPMTEPGAQTLAAVRRLDQYRPFEKGGATSREAVDELVLIFLAENDGRVSSIEECVDIGKTLFTVDLHEVEVARALQDLIKAARVEKNDGFRLTKGEQNRLEGVAQESADCRDQAIQEWRGYLLEQWPGLNEGQLQQLESDLDRFLCQVLYRQGSEAALLLYPDLPEAQAAYEELENMGVDFLPNIADPEVRAIRSIAFSHLIRRPTDTQKRWLGQQLNTTYFWRVISIDPEGARLIRELATGQRVYLDTNMVYRLLGVQGPRYVRPAETIVKTTQEVGYECCVTSWTVREFRASLKRAAEFLKLYPLPTDEYSDLLAEATSDDDFVTAYWRRVKDSGLKVQDFVAHFEEVESNLEHFGIRVVDDACKAVEDEPEAIENQTSILSRVLLGRYRSPEPIAHDVKHRLLIKRLRGSSDRRFANAGFWFLTFDSVLPRYDVHARREDGSTLPFCVSAGSWFQIVEGFRPKTDDSLQLLADLLASPYVRYHRELSKDAAQAIAARVALHKGGDPRLAARIMMNSALTEEIEAAEGEERTVLIDKAIVAAAQQAQDDARDAQLAAESARQEARAAGDEARRKVQEAEHQHAAELRDKDERIKAARRDETERAEKRLADERRKHDEAVQVEKERSDAAEVDAQRQRRLNRRLITAGAAIAVAILGILALGPSSFWAVVLVVAVLVGLWAAAEQWWIQKVK